jgi:hypothetical protein
MIEVKIRKAQRTGDNAENSVRITIDQEINTTSSLREYTRHSEWMKALTAEHEYDAEKLCNALTASLPGGTLDRLAVKLLQHQVSVLSVRSGRSLPPKSKKIVKPRKAR